MNGTLILAWVKEADTNVKGTLERAVLIGVPETVTAAALAMEQEVLAEHGPHVRFELRLITDGPRAVPLHHSEVATFNDERKPSS